MGITRSSEAPEQPRACAYRRGVARPNQGPNEMQQYGGRFKTREKLGHNLTVTPLPKQRLQTTTGSYFVKYTV